MSLKYAIGSQLCHVYADVAVAQDIGIATFLMLLWKDMYAGSVLPQETDLVATEPWKGWPRPPAGFLDLG